MNLRGIGYIGLAVPDVAQWSDFATSVIGLEPIDPPARASAPESVGYFRADERQWRIALHQADRPGLAYVGFEVLDEAAFRAAVAHLEAEGLGPKSATDDELAARGVRAMAHVQDPSGTCIEIFWGPAVDEGFRSPAGVPRFVGDNGFGHFVSLVSDLDQSMDFYLRVLGMRLSDFVDVGPGMSIQFLRCNARHHNVALGHFGPIDGLHPIAIEGQRPPTVRLGALTGHESGRTHTGVPRRSKKTHSCLQMQTPGALSPKGLRGPWPKPNGFPPLSAGTVGYLRLPAPVPKWPRALA